MYTCILSKIAPRHSPKYQDPTGIRTQDLLNTSQTLVPLSYWISDGRGVQVSHSTVVLCYKGIAMSVWAIYPYTRKAFTIYESGEHVNLIGIIYDKCVKRLK